MKAARETFLEARLTGCWFHFNQVYTYIVSDRIIKNLETIFFIKLSLHNSYLFVLLLFM
ncbi:hypothetical protein ALC57_09064 [Trachymyrmex cornetzi]|uniref:Uncharacterized protein n=1 Tax=Trachymyrmex cornetzi TaxID=471704 RepID=A0A151J640_9HYME|nr:hypothetical protein ALC57_09064 [Trachymyrmex cornetzi]